MNFSSAKGNPRKQRPENPDVKPGEYSNQTQLGTSDLWPIALRKLGLPATFISGREELCWNEVTCCTGALRTHVFGCFKLTFSRWCSLLPQIRKFTQTLEQMLENRCKHFKPSEQQQQKSKDPPLPFHHDTVTSKYFLEERTLYVLQFCRD